MKRYVAYTTAALAALALLAGCGSSSSNSSTSSSTPTTTSASSSGYGSSSGATQSSAVAMVSTTKGKPGTFIVDANGRTLYLFEKDKGTTSECSGACAQAWPPLTTSSAPKAGSGVKGALLGTTKRSDGTLQVTYGGHPLYTFVRDTKAGDVTGQGSKAFGAGWYVVTPAGKKIDDDEEGGNS